MRKNLIKSITSVALAATMLFTACGETAAPENNTQQPAQQTTETKPSETTQQTTETKPAEEVQKVVTPANFEVPAGGYDGSEVTITFTNTAGEKIQAVFNEYIEEFNKIYPNIHIKNNQLSNYDAVRDDISQKMIVDKEPNIAYCYPDHVALYNLAEKVVHLDNLIASTEKDASGILGLTQAQIDDFIDVYYEEGASYGDNHMYTFPLYKSTEVLYYNKDFFDKNELDVPTTWDEMEELIAEIKTMEPSCVPLGYDSEANWFITMCEQLGTPYTSATGDHFIFNDPANVEFTKRFAKWAWNEQMTTQNLIGTYTSSIFTATEGTKSYMTIGSSAGATHQRPTMVNGKYPFEVGIAPIPQADPSNPKVISQGPSVCIFSKENPQEVIASWLFIKFLTTSVDFQAAIAMETGYMPVIKSVESDPQYAEFIANANGGDNVAALSIKVAMSQKDANFVSPAFDSSSKARDNVGKLMQAVFAKQNADDTYIKEQFELAIKRCLGTAE